MIGAGWTQGALRAKAGLERRGLRVAENFFGNSGFSVINESGASTGVWPGGFGASFW